MNNTTLYPKITHYCHSVNEQNKKTLGCTYSYEVWENKSEWTHSYLY